MFSFNKLKALFKNLKLITFKQNDVVFFVIPTGDCINGGVMSIVNIFNESKNIFPQKKYIFFTPSETPSFNKFTKFENNIYIYKVKKVMAFFSFNKIDKCLINVPEYFFDQFMKNDFEKFSNKFLKSKTLQINILNQNINYMPTIENMVIYKQMYGSIFSITCAHKKYSTIEIANSYGVPYHFLSVYIDQSFYKKIDYELKENVIVISPDLNNSKELVLEKLKNDLPSYQIIMVENMTFDYYKALIGKAKFCITFGEGLDGYFIEPIFSKSISFAVFNEDFFTVDFKDTVGVFDSYNHMINNIVNTIQQFDQKEVYNKKWHEQFILATSHYNIQIFKKNLKDFYLENYNVFK